MNGVSDDSYEREGMNFTITPRNFRNLWHGVAFCDISLVIVKFRAGRIGMGRRGTVVEKVRLSGTFRDILGHFLVWNRGHSLQSLLYRRYVGCYQHSTGVRLRQIRGGDPA